MKIAFTTICLATTVTAFSTSMSRSTFGAISVGSSTRSTLTSLASDKKDKEEEGFDLDLGEMFQMFDAADKEVKFDDAVKKIKKDDKSKTKK